MKQEQATIALNISRFPIHYYDKMLPFQNVNDLNYELPHVQQQVVKIKPKPPPSHLKCTRNTMVACYILNMTEEVNFYINM